jgi:hypothetical protein
MVAITSVGTTSNTSGATLALSGVTVPAGVLLCVSTYESNGGTSIGSVADTVNTYTNNASLLLGGFTSNPRVGLFFVPNCLALSGGTITYTKRNSGSTCCMSVFYATGVIPSSPYDANVYASSNFGASGSTNNPVGTLTSGTPTVGGELFLGFAVGSNTANSDNWGGTDAAWTLINTANTANWNAAIFSSYFINSGVSTKSFSPANTDGSPNLAFAGAYIAGFQAFVVPPLAIQQPATSGVFNPAQPYLFFGGPQPYAGRLLNPAFEAVEVDNPPVQNWATDPGGIAEIVQAWQPDLWIYDPLANAAPNGPYMPPRMSAAILGIRVDNPPFQHSGRNPLVNIVQGWQPDPWTYGELGPQGGTQPYGQRNLNPSITAVPVNPPPPQDYSSSTGYPAVVAAWQPDPWTFNYSGPAGGTQPYAPRQLNPFFTAVKVDNPPFQHPGRLVQTNVPIWQWQPEVWPYVFTGGAVLAQPYGQAHLSPSIHGIVRNDPPFTHPSRTAAYMALTIPWQPDPWVYNELGSQGGTQPYGPRNLSPFYTAVEVDNPPFGVPNIPTLSAVVGQWQPDAWPPVFMGNRQAYMGSQLSPGVPGQSIDEPPHRHPERQPQAIVVTYQWQPPTWPYVYVGRDAGGPYMPPPVDIQVPGTSVDNPPFRHPARLPQAVVPVTDWQPEAWPYVFMGGWQPYEKQNLPPQITAVPIQINYRLTVRNVIVKFTPVAGQPWPGPTYPPKNTG